MQIVPNYKFEELVGRQVAAVVNFPPKQIGPFMSEVLVLGFGDEGDNVTLIRPDKTCAERRQALLTAAPAYDGALSLSCCSNCDVG